MEITKQVSINLNYHGPSPVVDAVQGDSARVLELSLIAGDAPWEIPVGAVILVQYQCADGTGGSYDTLPDGRPAYEVYSRGLRLWLPAQVCAVPGETRLQVTILDEATQLSTFELKVCVEPKVDAPKIPGAYTNLSQWWSQQGGGGLPTGGVAGQVLILDEYGHAGWEHATARMVGLENVDNTADWDKPISAAQQAGFDVCHEFISAHEKAVNEHQNTLDAHQETLDTHQETLEAHQETLDAHSVDYVVEQGTSGDWQYRKWASGLGEMWGSYHNVTNFTGSVTVTLPFEIVPWSMSAWVAGYHHDDETASNLYALMYGSPTTAGLTAWKHNSDAKSTKASCRIYIKCRWK